MPVNQNAMGNFVFGVSMDNVEFGNSLEAMKKQMKSMNKAMKNQLAGFASTDKSVEALENRFDAYSKMQEVAGKRVEKLTQRYADMEQQFGKNSQQAIKAADELNAASAEYKKYGVQLQQVEKDLEGVRDGTRELSENLSLLSTETKSAVKMFRAQGNEAQALRANIDGLNKEIDERVNLIDKEKQKMQQLKAQYGENSREVREQIVRIQQLETANQEARNSIGRLNEELRDGSAAGHLARGLSNIKDKAKELSTTLSATLTPALAGLAGAASVVATDSDTAFTKMRNAMGLTEKQTEALKKKARGLYNDGYGQSMDEVTYAITEVKQNLTDLDKTDLTFATKSAMNLANVYEADVNEVTRGANSLMGNFGLTAKDSFNILAKAAQNGGNKSRELFDNLAEYGVNFEGAGFSAQEMFNILTNGLKKGYNMDRLNDTILEFKLRAEDGGKAYQEAMKGLGNNSEVAAAYKAFEEGKITVADYYKVVQNNLGKIKKEMTTQEYENFGKVLFGTKIEDQGSKVVESMKTVNKEMDNVDGTMTKFNKNAEESFGQRFQGFLNESKGALEPLGLALLDIGEKYLPPLIEKLTQTAEWFKGLSDNQQGLVIGTGALVAALPAIGLALTAVLTPLKLLFNGFTGLLNFFRTGTTGISTFANVVSKLQAGFNLLKTGIGAALTGVRAFLGPVGLAITVITVLWTALKYAYNHSETFRNAVNRLKEGLSNAWQAIKSFNVTAAVSKMWTSVKNWFANGFNSIKSKMAGIRETMSNIWTNVKNKTVSTVTGMWSSVKNFFTSGYNTVKTKMTLVKTTMSNIWTSIKKLTVDKVSNMIDYVKKMPQKMADGIAKGKSALTRGAKKLMNGLISGVEWGLKKVTKGINTVLGWVGSDTKIQDISIPKFAKGTPQQGHAGGMALVNDAKGSNYKELIQTPDGKTFIPQKRNVMMNLPKGTQVLDGRKTKDLMKNKLIPHYKNGVGDTLKSAWESTKSGASSLWNGAKGVGTSAFNKVKDWSTEIWDWVTSPEKIKKLLMNVIGNVIPAKFSKGIVPSMMNGMMNKLVNQAKNFVFSITESMGGGDFGSYSPFTGDFNKISNKMGVYDFLYDLGKQIVSKFKSDYPSLYISNGKRKESKTKAGTTSDHVYGLGLDLARGGIKDESYYRMAKSLQGHPYLKYVIGSDKWNPNGGAFKKFPYGGHMNHLHLSAKSPSEAKKGGSGGGGGAGVEQWRSVAIQALKRTGDYSPTNLKALLRRMNQESSGQKNIVNNWDSNAKKGTPSKGLMQVIGPTFAAYRDKALSNDIFNPLANIVASIRYTKARYGSLTKGWNRLGGYENGGIITREHLAMVGEGNKPEAVIPLTKGKRSQALSTMAKAIGYMGGSTSTDSNELAQIVTLLQEQNSLAQTNNALLNLLLNKDTVLAMDGAVIATAVNKFNEHTNKRNRNFVGV